MAALQPSPTLPTCAPQVFMFIVNDKGTSWAYATPGFAGSLNQQVLRQLGSLAQVPEQAKMFTEVCAATRHSSLTLPGCQSLWQEGHGQLPCRSC